jgi:hypothetical protein
MVLPAKNWLFKLVFQVMSSPSAWARPQKLSSKIVASSWGFFIKNLLCFFKSYSLQELILEAAFDNEFVMRNV